MTHFYCAGCGKELVRRLSPVVVLLLLAGGCGPGGPLRTRLRQEVVRPEPGVVFFMVDGLKVDLLRDGCREGWLPNIQERFVEGGTSVENAVTSFPSVTYAILTTYATGVTPATHGVPANSWFDPRQRLCRDYAFIKHYRAVNEDFGQPTVYELLQPGVSASIQSPITRGLTQNFANWAVSGTMWFFQKYTSVDKLTATTFERVAGWANSRREWPVWLTAYFPGGDTIGHIHGPASEKYRAAVAHIDYQVGRVCDWLEAQGLLETTYLVLVSDHGMVDTSRFVDLKCFFEQVWGRAVIAEPVQDGSLESRRRRLERFDTVAVDSAGRFATVHFAGPVGWDEPASVACVRELLEDPPGGRHLWDLEGVELVVYAASENEIILRSATGTARIEERDGDAGREFRYVPVPDDVLGYLADGELAAFVAEGFHPSRAWLRATAAHVYPDVVPHLGQLLRSPRVGQVVLFAAPGYGFEQNGGGHGGIRREEVCIPMMFAGPGIEAGGTLAVGRAVDVVPTVLQLLGREFSADVEFEGVPLFEDVRVATEVTRAAR